MKNRWNNIRWRRGSGEILGFAFVLPFIVLLICAILSSAQISTSNQKLTYAAYSVCRAAVVSENNNFAEARADAVVKQIFGDNVVGGKFAYSSSSDREVPQLNHGEVFYVIESVGNHAVWQKGDMIKCTIYQQINPLMPFSSHRHSQSITMMIENGSSVEIEEAS